MRPARIRELRTKVVGVSYDNDDDSSSRQTIIATCRIGERVELIREPDIPYDGNAIKVCRANGEQLGHLKRRLAAEIVGKGQSRRLALARKLLVETAGIEAARFVDGSTPPTQPAAVRGAWNSSSRLPTSSSPASVLRAAGIASGGAVR
jgi:HIRAN domain